MDVQQQLCNYQPPFASNLNLQHRFYEEWTSHQSEDETPIPPKKPTLFQSSALDKKASDAPTIHPRKLRPIQPNRLVAPQDVPQRAPSPHSVLPLSTPPELRFSRPNGFDDLLNPISGDMISASGRQQDGERTNSPWTAPMEAKSRLPTPSLPSTHSLGDITLPSNAPALTNTYPYPLATIEPRQSFGLPRDQTSAGSGPLLRSSFSAPFNSSTMPQLEFAKETLDAPASGASGQSQSRKMFYETEQGLIQVPVNVQAASKTADEKRKRNATASHRFRQRRKEREQKTSDIISNLKAEVEYYQQERDFLKDILEENCISIPPRAPSPWRRRYASPGGSQHHDTSAYTPPPMPLQVLRKRTRSQGLFHPNANPFDATAPR